MRERDDLQQRLASLSSGARRLIEFVAVLDGVARYAVLRHAARMTEEDLVIDLKEAVDAGLIERLPAEPNTYVLLGSALREAVLAQVGESRVPRIRARAEAARRRVEGPLAR